MPGCWQDSAPHRLLGQGFLATLSGSLHTSWLASCGVSDQRGSWQSISETEAEVYKRISVLPTLEEGRALSQSMNTRWQGPQGTS